MKLWQKIFLMTLALVIIVVNTTSLALLTNNHRLAIEREQRNALAQHNYLDAEIRNTLIYTQLIENTIALSENDSLLVIFNVLDRQRNDETVGAALFRDKLAIYHVNKDLTDVEYNLLYEPDYTSEIVAVDDRTYLFLISTMDLNDQPYQLISSFDISSTYELFSQDLNQVRVIGIISALIVAGILLLLVRFLLSPLRNLSGTTRRIASGDLDKRATVTGHDEVAEVARDFNTMADSIEHNVTELEDLAESRRVFIGNLAHEMKTPLTSILGFADILRVKREVSDQDRVEFASVIVSETKRLQGLSSKLMELLTLGNLQITLEQIEIHDFANELTTILQPIVKSHTIKLVTELPDQEAFIYADRELLKSLVFNLVDNGIKASSPNTTIRLVIAIGGDDIQLAVVDEGIGIPADQIPQLAEPFYMLDKARTRKHGGAGLGLALCSEIAHAHDSELIIESIVGEGSSVHVALKKVTTHD